MSRRVTKDIYVEDEKLRELALAIVNKMQPEFFWILDLDVFDDIGFVRCYESKRTNDPRTVFADCRKVPQAFKAFCPYEVIITGYDPDLTMLSDNAQKIVLYHELKHLKWNWDEAMFSIQKHDTNDFYDILKKYGIDWNHQGAEVPDILAEEGVITNDEW